MGKTTTKTVQESKQSNTYGYHPGASSHDIDMFREFTPVIDPTIDHNYARQARDWESSYQTPLGAYTTPALRDNQIRFGKQNIQQEHGMARREAHAGLQGMQLAQKAAVAEMTAPKLVQTGGTSSGTGTQTTSKPLLGEIAMGAAQVGAGALM